MTTRIKVFIGLSLSLVAACVVLLTVTLPAINRINSEIQQKVQEARIQTRYELLCKSNVRRASGTESINYKEQCADKAGEITEQHYEDINQCIQLEMFTFRQCMSIHDVMPYFREGSVTHGR